jgi:hypothetical protein
VDLADVHVESSEVTVNEKPADRSEDQREPEPYEAPAAQDLDTSAGAALAAPGGPAAVTS